jgi:tetratricopeptide (TPR) repeat protein
MATHPDNHNSPQPDDQAHAGSPPEAQGEAGKPASPKQTHLARPSGKPTQLAPEAQGGETPNMSLEAGGEDIPVLEPAEPPAESGSDVVVLEPAEESTPEEIPVLEAADEAEPVFEEMEASPVEVTGSDIPGMEHTGSDHVLGDDLDEVAPMSEVHSGAPTRQGAAEIVQPSSKTEPVFDYEPGSAEHVLASEGTAIGSSAVRWDDVEEGSDAVKAAMAQEETAPFDLGGRKGEGPDESSAVNLGDLPGKVKSSSGVDAVAEALESGVNIEEAPAASAKESPSVEFDELLADDDSAASGRVAPKKGTRAKVEPSAPTDDELEEFAKKHKKKNKVEVDTDAGEALFADEEDEPRKSREQLEEEAVAAMMDDDAHHSTDEQDAVAVPVEDDEAVATVPADEDEAVAAAVEEEEAPAKKKKGKARDADEEEAPPAKGKTKPPPVTAGPSCLGRLVGAAFFVLVGVLLVGGAIAGLAFVMPDTLQDVNNQFGLIKPPPAKVVPQAAPASPVQKAYEALADAKYDEAISAVAGQDDDQAKAVRGEARLLKHLKSAEPGKLSKDDPEVKQGLEDLRQGKNEVLARAIERAFEPDSKAELDKSSKALKGVMVALAKAQADRKAGDQKLKDATKQLAAAATDLAAKDTALAELDKALKDANVKGSGAKGIGELLGARQEAEKKLGEVDKALAGANVKAGGAKGVQELLDLRAKLQKDRDDLDAATKGAYAELAKAGIVPGKGDPRKQLAEAVKLARERGESPLALPLAQLGTSLAGIGTGVARLAADGANTGVLAAKLALYQSREPFIETPSQKLDTYAALLQDRNRKDAGQLNAVVREADWVNANDPKAGAKALYVKGLAQRNQGDFDAARKSLDAAIKGAKGAGWEKQAKKALAELTDARAYYVPRIAKLQATGDFKTALEEADAALKAMPGDGSLLAERGVLRLELYRTKGKLSAEAQQQVRNDAEAAIKTGRPAEGAYVLGMLEEETGQYGKAEDQYRKALKAHEGSEDAASRYRIGLARVLLRDRPAAAPPAPPPAPPAPGKDDKKDTSSRLTPPAGRHPTLVHPVSVLLVTAVIGAQPAQDPDADQENPVTAKRVRESLELAKSLAASKDPAIRDQGYELLAQAASKAGAALKSTTCMELAKDLMARPDPKVRGTGHLLMGQGLVKEGRRTEGLKEYSRGLELLYPGLQSKEIVRMVDEHPAFQLPDAAAAPNPLIAEKHFGKGLHLYWSRQYPAAEAEFKQAIDYYGQDARYLYFLGLAQLAQKTTLKRDQAYYSFEKGAQLEAQRRPSITEINTSIERIQGDLRQLLNSFRFKSVAAAGV